MKTFLTTVLLTITTILYSQQIEWENNFGGSDRDQSTCIQQTTDGGYVISGYSISNDGDVEGNNGGYDCWIIKTDSNGILIWETNLGGSDNDFASSIQQTTDGGYIVAGSSSSSDGDVGGNYGNRDSWIIKLDNNGNLLWETNLGGSQLDRAFSIQQTLDGGYIFAGGSSSNDGDVGGNNGDRDFWIVKLNSIGTLLWETNLGGSNYDRAFSIIQTIDGGYIAAGESSSTDGDVGGNNGAIDFWIVKIDSNGNLIWETNLGGSGNDIAESIQQTTDGGFIIAGWSESNNGDVSGNNGASDYWIIKLNNNGDRIWETNLGGSSMDYPSSIIQTSDGGFIVAGDSLSFNGDVGGNNGFSDFWIVKLDANGTIQTEKNFGGSLSDNASSITQTTDGGFIVSGFSDSTDGDVGGNNGDIDFWIVKLGPILGLEDNILLKNIILAPNPAIDLVTISNFPKEIIKIDIIDLKGRLIHTYNKLQNNTIDISSLQSATYLVKIYAGNTIFHKKIIKK